jgi:hypothetical protein
MAHYAAFLPGLTYFAPGTPKVPVDRGSTAQASAHFIPTQFDAGITKLLQFANATAANPVECSEPLVEANIIDSPKGSVVILSNWSGGPVKALEVTLPADLAKKKLTVASGAEFKKDGEKVMLDLDVAEALILR